MVDPARASHVSARQFHQSSVTLDACVPCGGGVAVRGGTRLGMAYLFCDPPHLRKDRDVAILHACRSGYVTGFREAARCAACALF